MKNTNNLKFSAISFGFNFLIFFGLLGCVTEPKKIDSKILVNQWEAKAQIQDLKKNKTHQVSLDFSTDGIQTMRVDVKGTMGVSLASLVFNKEEISYALPQQKKFYSGGVSSRALLPLFAIELNPAFLQNICLDRPILDNEWSCKLNADKKIERCDWPKGKMKITWAGVGTDQKRVEIYGPDFEVRLVFKKATTNVQVESSIFKLNAPEGFAKHKLN